MPLALDDFTKTKVTRAIEAFFDKRVPAHVRDQVKMHVEFHGTNATLFEDRPPWRDPNEDWTHMPVAQFRLDQKSKNWTLYCCDRNGKWHLYEPKLSTTSFEMLIHEVYLDPTGIFWG